MRRDDNSRGAPQLTVQGTNIDSPDAESRLSHPEVTLPPDWTGTGLNSVSIQHNPTVSGHRRDRPLFEPCPQNLLNPDAQELGFYPRTGALPVHRTENNVSLLIAGP